MRHFNYNEFDSPDEVGSGLTNMDQPFLDKLDDAREEADVSFNINSGYRTINHNDFVSGKSNSSHLKGLAADIACNSSRKRFLILKALINVGFTRIGIADTFIHVDDDKNKDQQVNWLY